MWSDMPASTTFSASRRNDQRLCPWGGVATGKRGNFGALGAVNFAWTARTRGIVEAVQTSGAVLVAQCSDGVVVEVEGSGNILQSLAALELKQGGSTLELSGLQAAFGKQPFEC